MAKKPAKTSQEEWDRIPSHLKGDAHRELHLCANIKNHDYGPDGYTQWHGWAEEKGKTHKTIPCQCGFYNMIWIKKESKDENGTADKCKYCDAEPEFLAMVENDYDPYKHHTEWVCSEHMETIKAGIIESWTKREWLEME